MSEERSNDQEKESLGTSQRPRFDKMATDCKQCGLSRWTNVSGLCNLCSNDISAYEQAGIAEEDTPFLHFPGNQGQKSVQIDDMHVDSMDLSGDQKSKIKEKGTSHSSESELLQEKLLASESVVEQLTTERDQLTTEKNQLTTRRDQLTTLKKIDDDRIRKLRLKLLHAKDLAKNKKACHKKEIEAFREELGKKIAELENLNENQMKSKEQPGAWEQDLEVIDAAIQSYQNDTEKTQQLWHEENDDTITTALPPAREGEVPIHEDKIMPIQQDMKTKNQQIDFISTADLKRLQEYTAPEEPSKGHPEESPSKRPRLSMPDAVAPISVENSLNSTRPTITVLKVVKLDSKPRRIQPQHLQLQPSFKAMAKSKLQRPKPPSTTLVLVPL